MEILKREKVKSWHERLLEMEVGEVKPYDWKLRRSIRGTISDKLLNDFPETEFATKKKENSEGVVYLEVTRIK